MIDNKVFIHNHIPQNFCSMSLLLFKIKTIPLLIERDRFDGILNGIKINHK
ncbi:hypothetical protein HMPREF3218_0202280 [Prevotella bivia]|nr:hypothetical protein HMPREF3218_0202280 [Prevotella bivia]